MNRFAWYACSVALGLAVLGPLQGLAQTASGGTLSWRTNENRVSADIGAWNLVQTLERISAATGWRVYLEPGTRRSVSVKFQDRTPDKALDMLLGDLGRVLLPATNGGRPRLLVFRTEQKQATQLIQPKPALGETAKPIANELVVKLKPGESIEELARKLGAKVVGRNDDLNAYRLRFEDAASADAARESLKEDRRVASVDNNFNMVLDPEADGFGLGMARLQLRPKAVPDSDRIVIGLIDTAVQREGTTLGDFLLPGIEVAGASTLPAEIPTHGTSMAETLLRGVSAGLESDKSSRVRILPVNVYGPNDNTTTFDVANGIYRAINSGSMIINLSLGSEGNSSFLRDMIQSGHEQGVIFVASAGNQPVDTPMYPAAYPEVIAVTAGDGQGNIASYANFGAFVDVVGPGTAPVNFNNQVWRVTGTSPAAAFTAGFAGGKGDGARLSWAQIEAAIRNSQLRR